MLPALQRFNNSIQISTSLEEDTRLPLDILTANILSSKLASPLSILGLLTIPILRPGELGTKQLMPQADQVLIILRFNVLKSSELFLQLVKFALDLLHSLERQLFQFLKQFLQHWLLLAGAQREFASHFVHMF
jgi:hypothetical protein